MLMMFYHLIILHEIVITLKFKSFLLVHHMSIYMLNQYLGVYLSY